MTKFRTEITLPKVQKQLSYRRNALMIGSCFTENIGNYLQNHCFPIETNPCGILYNPASIAECTDFLVREKQLTSADIFYANGLWNSYYFHSRYSHPDPETALMGMNNSISLAAGKLKSASHLFLTFGTSWIYREKERHHIVGNCHKLPADHFNRQRLSVEEMSDQWIELLNRLFAHQPELSIVFTISPIRHLKDGSYENQVSKSSLFLLVDKLVNHFGPEKISYFPSYELVMDELRDYRFYASDMLHLSETATTFVQEKFNEIYLDPESKEINFLVGKIVQSLKHRPFQNSSSAYGDLLSKLLEDLLALANRYPFLILNDLIIEINQKKGL